MHTPNFVWSAPERERMLQSLAEENVDLLIIGGGITGAGIALDAAARGLRTALVEMQDFAAGTSSRSTKLIHGGLRYLKQLEFKVVAETGRERAVVYENGPHVTTPEWMLLPFYKGGQLGPVSSRLGLALYDFLAGVAKDEWHKMLDASETLRREPLLRKEGLKGGGYYVEYRTDDARLTLEVLKRAVEFGATAVNYAAVGELLYDGSRLAGAVVRDRIGGGRYALRARHIVNATGPWVDGIRELDRSKHGKSLRLIKGVHLVFDQKRFPLRQSVYFDAPGGRMVFAIPREGKTYIGTTESDYAGDPANPRVEADDLLYLLDAANAVFPSLGLTPGDVESGWAGLRPLIRQDGKNPSEISRKDEIFLSPSGLISIAGGKLTGYRKMAGRVVDLVSRRRQADGLPALPASPTRTLAISGGDVGGSAGYEAYVRREAAAGTAAGLAADEADRIARRYGSNAPRLFALAGESHDFANRHGLPLALAAELRYAVLAEMAASPADFWIRRTGRLYFDRPGVLRWKSAVSAAMAELLRWSAEQREMYDRELDRLLAEAAAP
jgi:glycerol-3-phosphate dehydrogenase